MYISSHFKHTDFQMHSAPILILGLLERPPLFALCKSSQQLIIQRWPLSPAFVGIRFLLRGRCHCPLPGVCGYPCVFFLLIFSLFCVFAVGPRRSQRVYSDTHKLLAYAHITTPNPIPYIHTSTPPPPTHNPEPTNTLPNSNTHTKHVETSPKIASFRD